MFARDMPIKVLQRRTFVGYQRAGAGASRDSGRS